MATLRLRFLAREFIKSDSDWKEGDWNCVFETLKNRKRQSMRETKLLKRASLRKGVVYQIDFGNKHYPTSIEWEGGKVFIRHNNAIIVVDEDGNETNTSSNTIRQMMYRARLEAKKKKKG